MSTNNGQLESLNKKQRRKLARVALQTQQGTDHEHDGIEHVETNNQEVAAVLATTQEIQGLTINVNKQVEDVYQYCHSYYFVLF